MTTATLVLQKTIITPQSYVWPTIVKVQYTQVMKGHSEESSERWAFGGIVRYQYDYGTSKPKTATKTLKLSDKQLNTFRSKKDLLPHLTPAWFLPEWQPLQPC